jgi:hypothetical protein
MRGPKGDEMQEPAGNATAWIGEVTGEDRNSADAGEGNSAAANMIAMPRIVPPLFC